MRILYLADIRFPLERANGIQSMETCHALASRGHHLILAVRPDPHTPARDPFEFYGLPRLPAEASNRDVASHANGASPAKRRASERVGESEGQRPSEDEASHAGSMVIEVAPITGPAPARRAGYLTFALGRALGRARQDVIFTRDLGVASMLLRLPRGMRAPVVYEAHTIAAEEAVARPRMLTGAPAASAAKIRRLAVRERHVWTAADGYVTITAGLKAELERKYGPRTRIAVVPDGARAAEQVTESAANHGDHTDQAVGRNLETRPRDTLADVPNAEASQAVFTIGYAGHLYPWKGVDLIIEAVTALQNTRALIIGGHDQEPDLARVKAVAVELDCASRVVFTGLLPPRQVAARLRDADVLVLPNPASAVSSAFTSPLKLFEYMAAAKPIVASDLPAIREVLTHERNALLFEPGNPQALTAAIRRINEDAALAERLARQALEDVREYTWARRAERLEALFNEVLATRSQRGAQRE